MKNCLAFFHAVVVIMVWQFCEHYLLIANLYFGIVFL